MTTYLPVERLVAVLNVVVVAVLVVLVVAVAVAFIASSFRVGVELNGKRQAVAVCKVRRSPVRMSNQILIVALNS